MNIDQLKQIIQKANPEIMDYKEGCRFKGGVMIDSYYAFDFENEAVFDNLDGLEEVTGRPIRLADVLLAMANKWHKKLITTFSVSGPITFWQETDEYPIQLFLWNPLDDNLDNQSEATKQFLINLLVSSN